MNSNLTRQKHSGNRIEKVNQLQTQLLRAKSIEEAAKQITDAVVDIFDADFCRVWLTGPGDLCESGCMHAAVTEGPHVCKDRQRCLVLRASSGRYKHIDGKVHRRVPFGCYKIGRVAADQERKFITNDVTRDLRVHNREWAAELGLVSFAGYQLRPSDGEAIGVLALFSKHLIAPMDDALLESVSNITAQVLQTLFAEETLKKQNKFLNDVLESLTHPFCVIDADDYTVKIANAAAKANSVSDQSTCYHMRYHRNEPCDGNHYPCPLHEVKKTKKPFVTEHTHCYENGDIRHLEVHAYPLFDNEGTVSEIIEYSLDITDRRQKEKELQESQRRYESLINNTVFGVAIVDKKHKIIRINPVFSKLFKKPAESFIGKDCFREFEKRDEICPHCPGVRAMASGKTEEVETEGVRDDGTRFIVRNRAIPFVGSNNEVAGFIEIVEDVDKLKRAEERLKESEEKYRKQFEGALDAIFLADFETGIIMDCNQAALKLLGREKTELIGRHQRILHPSDEIDGEYSKSFLEHRRQTDGTVLETKIVTQNGDIRDVAVKASLLEIGGAKVLQGIFRDITENKQREKFLRTIQEELIEASHRAGMAEVATDVLHNVGNVLNSVNVSASLISDKLTHSEIPNLKKVADMLDENKQNLSTFLLEDSRGQHVLSYLTKVFEMLANDRQDMIGKLSILIDDVNHIKTIVRVQQEYTKIPGVEIVTTIGKLIDDAIRMNQPDLERQKIQILRDDAGLGSVRIEKHRVIQILVNLISNAKHALAGCPAEDRILAIRSYLQGDSHLRIEVTDNGVGILKGNLTRIFQHGFTTQKDGHGFGLHSGALAAKEIDGSLTVRSEGPGRGATFTLELPYKPAGAIQWVL